MANAVRANSGRNINSTRAAYIDGNTVRSPKQLPAARPKKKISQSARKNRQRALGMSPGFVVFLALICAATLFACVHFLQMKAEITGKVKTVATLESELNQLKADNDAYYSQVTSSEDLNAIKAKAIHKLGMKYPSEDQIKTYETERSSYVRQYQDVPESK